MNNFYFIKKLSFFFFLDNTNIKLKLFFLRLFLLPVYYLK